METILLKYFKFGSVLQEGMPFKDISYLELLQLFCSMEQTICAILVEYIMRNNSVKLFCFWTSGSDEDAI